MKMKNIHVQRLAEIRTDFMSPPHVLKIAAYALARMEEAVGIVQEYKDADKRIITQLVDVMETVRQAGDDKRIVHGAMKTFSQSLSSLW